MLPIRFCCMGTDEQHQLQALANALPADPVIVEIGAFIGGSIVVMHQSRPDAKFVVIEDFLNPGVHTDAVTGKTYTWYDLGGRSSKELFLENTAHINNLELHEMHGNETNYHGKFDDLVCDMLFEDAGLTDIDYWVQRVKPGGIFCGHDYRNAAWHLRNPHISVPANDDIHVQKVDSLVKRWDATLNVVNTFWWFVKPF